MVKQMQDRKNDHNSYTQFSMQRYNIKSVASDFKHFAKASSVGIIPAALSPLTFPFVSAAVAGLVWDLISPIFAHVLRFFSINHLIDLVNMTNQIGHKVSLLAYFIRICKYLSIKKDGFSGWSKWALQTSQARAFGFVNFSSKPRPSK